MLEGELQPEQVAMKEMVRSAQKRDYSQWLDRHQVQLVQDLLDSRKSLLEAATGNTVTTPKLDTRLVSGGQMRRRVRKRYLDEITRIKREVGEAGLSSDDEGIDEQEWVQLPKEARREVEERLETPEQEGEEPLTQDMQPCFLSLLRELFLAGQGQRLSLGQLDRALLAWQNSPIAALNAWYQDCPEPQVGNWTENSRYRF